ncbi:MAG: hypothetical protein H0W21_08015 [Actinobacteria bacterium]|nr:hypothetical protein [Actinomycetota bacterium]
MSDLRHTDVIDLGDITYRPGTEMYLPLWARLWAALGTPMFNLKIGRAPPKTAPAGPMPGRSPPCPRFPTR